MARTPSARAHEKVLEAALELVAKHGIDATSMDAVARRSGVSKATIYKHWADKEALLLEVLAWASGLQDRPVLDPEQPRAGMLAVLSYKPKGKAEWSERITPHFAAYGATHPEFGAAWRNMVLEPPRRELSMLIEAARKKGELRPEPDIESALAILLGPMLYWHIFAKGQKKPPAEIVPLAEAVVSGFWAAFSTTPSRRR